MRNVKNLTLFVLMPALVSTAALADIHYINPGESIQAAIVAADPGDEIEVAPGTYTEAIDFIGKAVRLYSSGGPDVTTIDGTGHYHVVQCINYEGRGTILEGFTITGGNATGYSWEQYGGGMFNYAISKPTVTNCTFTENTAEAGGGMFNYNASPTVTNCTFSGNTASFNGGGMCNAVSSRPTVTNCTFTGNTVIATIASGGGMYNESCRPTVTNCTFTDNGSSRDGGGMCNDWSGSTVTNCTFTGNTAAFDGGGMWNNNSSPTMTNCTFTGNTAIDGGGMYNYNASPTVTNCILWGDTGSEIYVVGDTPTVTYSDVQSGTGEIWFGEGCIDTDPLFADAEGRLLAFSPCLDAGSDDAVPPGVTTDLDGNPRIQGVCVDMGAFESDLNYMDPGWVFMPQDAPDFGYSVNEADLLYFYSFNFVQSLNTNTWQWSVHMPNGWVYVHWPFYFELDPPPGTLWFALPPAGGIGVYHFSTGQWEVLPQIIP